MAFTNSPLATYTRISPNRNSPRNQPISKITIHHQAGVNSVEGFGNIVASPARGMSANYAIGNDGRIGLFCPESDRSWCSSNPDNDHRAITIEVSNSAYGDASGWPVSDAAYNSLIKLCVDICKRNGIPKLVFTGDKNGSLTYHYMFAPTACPGPWIKAHTQDICDKVNGQLGLTVPINPPVSTSKSFKVGDLVSIKSGAKYYTGSAIPNWVVSEKWFISSIAGDRAVLGLNESKNRNIQSPINTKDITLVTTKANTYTKSLKASDLLYSSAGGRVIGTVGANGVFTIVEEKNINGVVYGKLKSGAGWVITSNNSAIRVGDYVKVINPIIYGTTKKFTVFVDKYKVLEVNGERIVISADGKHVTSAISKTNIQKI